ncbi:MAG: hypothetical protein ACLFM8_06185 [Halobacteriales archaeon]
MTSAITEALRDVRDHLIDEPVQPPVETARDVNRSHCRYVAEAVATRLDDHDVQVLADGGHGYAHTWLFHDGRHYDVECVEGVEDYRDLPFFRRHPEAAVRPVEGPTDQSALRRRGTDPTHPER